MQLAYFPQYVGAFLAGLAAARYGWLTTLAASPSARRIGRIALICAPLSLLAILLLGLDSTSKSFDTGLHWQAFVLALWEQFAGVGLSLGLFWLFSHKLDRIRPAFAWMVDRSFAVYVLHPPVLVALTMLYRSLPQNPFALAALLTVTGLVASFIVADLARRMPVLRQIL
jgi:surface polysaccharide O-acyltransferase-like enzyme